MEPTEALKPAVLWTPLEGRRVHCRLCGFSCQIAEGKLGHCAVRKNIDGKLYSLNYGKVVAGNPDPIEKKPLFHFLPGSRSFSIAAVGCNFRCEFCQNWQISQAALVTGRVEGERLSPEQIVEAAVRTGCRSVAYTYTEPTVFMELAQECGKAAKAQGLANVFVSNGYMTREAIDFAAEWLDGVNVDLKAFSDEYYRTLCSARLQPVLDCISYIARNTGIWMEITTLLLPGRNDSEEELRKLAEFLVSEVGPEVPWHISRFYPQYRYTRSEATPLETLRRAAEIGKAAGLRYVYLGNVPGEKSESTYCPGCGRMLIERMGYQIVANRIENSKCPHCGTGIAGFGL
ncbi:MAG TPA: AmmeMemoRadiSam system radical SAM enzyme [Sedimentisphaerales bacterium]|nr:AmmeMemoRadiSam system radical SAM enzyme [Phycisphaerae bacterium]HON92695.1 AmmeMemoRadiSam system radical SAM enzyme [Sedimentisphaerales bacterium]HQI28746.1 AmmeMemoRadiSam system radical SAM enzyme [Sedimentisphaerales bacterium]